VELGRTSFGLAEDIHVTSEIQVSKFLPRSLYYLLFCPMICVAHHCSEMVDGFVLILRIHPFSLRFFGLDYFSYSSRGGEV
jgi:hypothetical protein